MLRQLRHISEGHYYGLRVTNNAENEHLNKELRTLDACKDVQSHCYRKEEKDLVNTLMRLKKSKDHKHNTEEPHRRHERHDTGHSTRLDHGPKHHNSRENIAHHLSRKGEKSHPRDRSDHVLCPAEAGSVIHRTMGFIDCVICNLPRSSHVTGTQVCTCDKGPDKGTHHMHPPAIHDDRTRPEYLSPRQKRQLELRSKKHTEQDDERKSEKKEMRRGSLDAEEAAMFLMKLQREMNQAIEQPSSLTNGFSSEKRAHSPRKGESNYEEKGHFWIKARRGSQLEDERFRTRQDSIDEEGPYAVWNRHRKGSVDDHDYIGRKRGPSIDYGIRERNESLGGESYYSVGELRSRTSTMEDPSMSKKLYRMSNNTQLSPSPSERNLYEQRHSFHRYSPHEETHLPKLVPEKKNNEAFHGLIHPDNVINHHHFLPYEANTVKQRHHDDHRSRREDQRQQDKRHFHGYYIHKYDHTGSRQTAHIPVGANVHLSEMIDKQHEPESKHFTLLSNLRQLLSVYQRLEDTSHKYPWPSPPSIEVTPEEFQKLKDCRYLRLPRSMDDITVESPVFH